MYISMEEFLDNITTTTVAPGSPGSAWIAYIAIIISILFFGSNFVPAAKYPIGDGLSCQFFFMLWNLDCWNNC